ncbi:LLM class flavin-dependent oxidoreductase [Dongia deserti]|uniref:LLM class flavin-dependent oxidoreductase n=1 Tax=Dongia deserti TaxID=2268030 RepID=UPI000E646511|nr:LLM class flavin-dependent oxidoreductase [Dongia deserti]
MIPFSVLDLSPITEGATAADALRNTLDLARHAEKLRYRRYWLAEHHNMPGIASAATAVVIGYVAAGTKTIRVGSGGIMLPNHAPLVIAEQFGTLESLFPGRIDLGLGRAPGTDMMTARALRRDLGDSGNRFPEDVAELRAYLSPAIPGQRIRAVPGEGLKVPIWLLGSSLYSAQLAAMLGLPFAFASHFAPGAMMEALALYRSRFEPSAELARPYAMLGLNIIAAETDQEAAGLFTSLQQSFVNLRRGQPGRLPPPIEDFERFASPVEQAQLRQALACSFVGGAEAVKQGLADFINRTQADELIVSGHIFDHAARLRSFAIAAEVRDDLAREAKQPEQRIIGSQPGNKVEEKESGGED